MEKHPPGKTKDNLRELSEDRGDKAAAKKDGWVMAPGYEKTVLRFPKKRIIFSQGEPAEAVLYIQAGQVQLSVVSQAGKKAVVGILEPGAFFGETCLAAWKVCGSSGSLNSGGEVDMNWKIALDGWHLRERSVFRRLRC